MGLFDFVTDSMSGLLGGGGGANPSDAAMPYLNKAQGSINQSFNPYMQQGQGSYSQLNPLYTSMMNDPASHLESLMQKYQPSRGYELKRDEMLKAAGNTAAAGGMRGSFNDQSNESQIAGSLMGQDMQQWLQNVMGIQGTGLSGQQHFYDTGYDAAKNYAGDTSNLYGVMAGNAFQNAREQNKRKSDMLSGLLGLGGGIGGAFLGAPAGPLGMMAGASAGSQLGGGFGRMFG